MTANLKNKNRLDSALVGLRSYFAFFTFSFYYYYYFKNGVLPCSCSN